MRDTCWRIRVVARCEYLLRCTRVTRHRCRHAVRMGREVVVNAAPLTCTSRRVVTGSGHNPRIHLKVVPDSVECTAACVAAELRAHCSLPDDVCIELFEKAYPPSAALCYYYKFSNKTRHRLGICDSARAPVVSRHEEAVLPSGVSFGVVRAIARDHPREDATTSDETALQATTATTAAVERSRHLDDSASAAPPMRIFVEDYTCGVSGQYKRLHSEMTVFDARQVSRMRAFDGLDDLRSTKGATGFFGVSSDKRHGVSYTFTYRCVDTATDREVMRRASGNFKTALDAAISKLSLYKHCVALFDAETGDESSFAVDSRRDSLLLTYKEEANDIDALTGASPCEPVRIVEGWYPCG